MQLNLVIPVRRVDVPAVASAPPHPGNGDAGFQALLRLLALAPILLGSWFVLPSSEIIMPIMACLVLAYPTWDAQRTEAFERLTTTVLGGAPRRPGA